MYIFLHLCYKFIEWRIKLLFCRFGTSKYTPPDRSEEIRPMQELLEEKQKADEEAEAASKNTVIKVLMGEVQVTIYNIIRYSIIYRNW